MQNQAQINKFDRYLITIFGLGYLKPSPGTYGSIVAFIFLLFPSSLNDYIIVFLIILTIISFFPIRRAEKIYGDDPSFIIIDEFLAMSFILTFDNYQNNLLLALLSLIIFRVFDIFKPFPINLLNRKQGALYVLADDFVAAFFTIISINLLIYLNNLIIIFKIL